MVAAALTGRTSGAWLIVALALAVAFADVTVMAEQLHARQQLRNGADAWLRIASKPPPAQSPFNARAAQLTSPKSRQTLARSLARITNSASTLHRGPLIMNSRTIRKHREQLLQLASRLADPDRPASPAGVLLIRDPVTKPDSPLYDTHHGDELAEQLEAISLRLDGEW